MAMKAGRGNLCLFHNALEQRVKAKAEIVHPKLLKTMRVVGENASH